MIIQPPTLDSQTFIPGPLRTRWAPSPTGHLHLGHLLHGLAVWGGATSLGADILLRFEDHDRQRCKNAYLDAAWRDMTELGFFGPGPAIVNPTLPYYRQSDHEDRYRAAFEQLRAAGLVYACASSRKELAGLDRYPGTYRDRGLPVELHDGPSPYALRVRIPDDGCESYTELTADGPVQKTGNPAKKSGDFVIRDRNGNWSYQFCVTVDDNVDGITLIIRGKDLEDSTLWQVALERLLTGSVRPKLYWHHPLLVGDEGEKLGKRIRSQPLRDWLDDGWSPEQLIAKALGITAPGAPQLALSTWLDSLKSSQTIP